ncbi:MAG: D-3-phosphoglycerate dehydrogenase [uncultured Actinomycetospora sp.]|uniref:D-3-phosphoglycerate dehydrogenase n=1 Tax=uncultured Actinomycetospora sp. TaxID=1135996 RepID=A0A6J4JYN5_9PSEU|nr:MAG: D-3-phosphoglycerate dehydrogenase [uncultured Actinomycetospora sp.]
MTARVLVTDHAWPHLDVETSVLAAADAELVVAGTGHLDELVALAGDVDAILTCFAKVPAEVLDAAPRCRTVARYGVGLDNIDVARATDLGMVVSNVVDYCTDEVADHTLVMILALARRLLPLHRDVVDGGWGAGVPGTSRRLRGRTLGLVGLGAIGRAVATRAAAIGMRVVALRRSDAATPGIETVDRLEDLLAVADVVSLHLPLTADTAGLIDAAALRAMRPDAWLINTARGGLVDTDALLAALERGEIAGAALDVTDPEPLPVTHPLRSRPDVALTPHSAFASDGSLAELARRAAENVVEVLAGRVPAGIVNPGVLTSPALRMSTAAAR